MCEVNGILNLCKAKAVESHLGIACNRSCTHNAFRSNGNRLGWRTLCNEGYLG